ncbi:MAG: N-acetylmuramoyl-L-alanine amidase [Bacteroidota bacterium]
MKSITTLKFLLAGFLISILFYFSIVDQLKKYIAEAPNDFISADKQSQLDVGISEAELTRLIAKSPETYDYFSIDDEGVTIYASAKAKAAKEAECKIYYEEFGIFNSLFKTADWETLQLIYENKSTKKLSLNNYNQYITEKTEDRDITSNRLSGNLPLSGIRIALDPGHIGGDMETALMEGKYVRISTDNGKNITAFNEGNLALETAKLLATKLIAQGAKVMLTRKEQGISAFGISYEKWLETHFLKTLEEELAVGSIEKKQYNFLKNKTDKKEKFHDFFKRIELKERANKINSFRPDLCLMLHYNIDEGNYFKRNRVENLMGAGKANYSMVFIPGAFLKNELINVEDRIQLLRMLITNDVAASMRLSGYIAEEFVQHLKVPPISPLSEMGYIKYASVFTGKQGVFARNLALTRMVHAPVCYGEPLCQDNEFEYKRLANLQNRERVIAVAETYYRGIMKYFKQRVM